MRHQDVKRERYGTPKGKYRSICSQLQEKFLVYSIAARTKTDTGGQGEDPEVSERTVAAKNSAK